MPNDNSPLPLLPINGRPGEQVLREIQPGYRPNPTAPGSPPADAVPNPPPYGVEPNPAGVKQKASASLRDVLTRSRALLDPSVPSPDEAGKRETERRDADKKREKEADEQRTEQLREDVKNDTAPREGNPYDDYMQDTIDRWKRGREQEVEDWRTTPSMPAEDGETK